MNDCVLSLMVKREGKNIDWQRTKNTKIFLERKWIKIWKKKKKLLTEKEEVVACHALCKSFFAIDNEKLGVKCKLRRAIGLDFMSCSFCIFTATNCHVFNSCMLFNSGHRFYFICYNFICSQMWTIMLANNKFIKTARHWKKDSGCWNLWTKLLCFVWEQLRLINLI
jgi:hypothetical protein